MHYVEYDKYNNGEYFSDLPVHWSEERIYDVATIKTSNVDKKTKEGEELIQLCNYVDVYYHPKIDSSIDFMVASASKNEIKRFKLKAGDVVITKDSEDPFDIGIPSIVLEDIDDLVCGYHLSIIQANKEKLLGGFLYYALESDRSKYQFTLASNGVTRFGLSQKGTKNLKICLPSIEEQQKIADFLDYKTHQIDQLIEKKKTLIEKLNEHRVSVITQAVTKGLDKNAKLKPSGVDWLGYVPEHWEVKSIKRMTVVGRGASPRPIQDPKYFDDEGEYAWVRIADVSANDHYLLKTTQRLSELGKSFSVSLEPGTLFLSIAGSVGKPMITSIKCCIHDGFVHFPHLTDNPEYLYYIFLCGQCYLGLGKLGTQLNLNTDTVGSIKIGLPSTDEQKDIVTYLDLEMKRIDRMVLLANSVVSRLNEYRNAIITNAVTGKIDLRDYDVGRDVI